MYIKTTKEEFTQQFIARMGRAPSPVSVSCWALIEDLLESAYNQGYDEAMKAMEAST